jgi:hypothetical protein
MKNVLKAIRTRGRRHGRRSQRGTALIIAIMVMALLAGFVAASLSRVTNETLMMANDQANTEAYFVAQAALEHTTREFGDVFDVRIRPTPLDMTRIESDIVPGYPDFAVDPDLFEENAGNPPIQTTVDPESPFAGLIALRTSWRISATARNIHNNAEVRLTRTLNNYTIPIFQFGIFYDDPMEHHPGPPFSFGGRVHTNGDIYLMAGNTSTRFRDRVTAAGEVVVAVARNGQPYTNWGERVRVNDGTGTYQLVSEGSVTVGPDTPERKLARGGGVSSVDDPDLPDGLRNANWTSFSARFRGNLIARSPELKLPLQIGNNRSPIEIIKRGLDDDDDILRDSRYYNKPGVRVTLSDAQAQLPGGSGGVQLNALAQPNPVNTAGAGVARGYWPTPRLGAQPRATKINGERLTTAGRAVWIKVETVRIDNATLSPVATDITEDILSLGMTERTNDIGNAVPDLDLGDTDAILKIQRFAIAGPPLKVANNAYFTSDAENNAPVYSWFNADGNSRNAYSYDSAEARSYVLESNRVNSVERTGGLAYPLAGNGAQFPAGVVFTPAAINTPPNLSPAVAAPGVKLLPFPIMMFDTREGLYNDAIDDKTAPAWQGFYHSANSQRVPVNGVMGMIDVDITNFRRLVEGAFDGTMPNGLTGAAVPDNDGIGWILYVSDRRNDRDNDGQWDMENVYVNPLNQTTGLERGEDVNHNGTLEVDYDNAGAGNGEGATYNTAIEADIAATRDTPWFRRAQRLVRGERLPGDVFKGFSYCSENGVYIQGNYNASRVNFIGTPTPFNEYVNDLGPMVPASVVADAITILSNQWNDGKSFRWAFEFGTAALDGRVPTTDVTIRTAMLMGDTISFDANAGPNQGGDPHLAGGVHNFKRFRENWDNRTVNYVGSLINLFNRTNNSGPFKCCVHVYKPPTRNWVFDENFLDPRRLPPGTPFFQYINITGFRRTFRQEN